MTIIHTALKKTLLGDIKLFTLIFGDNDRLVQLCIPLVNHSPFYTNHFHMLGQLPAKKEKKVKMIFHICAFYVAYRLLNSQKLIQTN